MATQQQRNDLVNLRANYQGLDEEKLFRKSLGEESLESFATKLSQIKAYIEIALSVIDRVGDISGFNSVAQQMLNQLRDQISRSNADFLAYKPAFLENIDSLLEQMKQYWPPFVSAQLENSGLLDNQNVKAEYKRTVEQMKAEAQRTIDEVRSAAEKLIEETRAQAGEIEGKARNTAAHISVQEAQNQFEDAAKRLGWMAILWAAVSGFFVVAFVVTAICFELLAPGTTDISVSVYHVALRLSILTAIGAAATFCLRILRAQLHMREQNLHRQRISNSVPAFVEAASSPEQRDLILSRLVDAVADFGNSGLIASADDSINPARMTIDSIAKNVTIPSH